MKHFYAILLCAAALVACDKTSQQTTRLDVGATELQVPAKGTVQQVDITTDGDWTAELSEKWVVASQLHGSGNSVVKLAVMTNTDYSSREAELTLTSGALTKTVKIVQAQMNGIIIEESTLDAGFDGELIEIPVKANVAYEVSSDAAWLTVIDTKALVESTVSVVAALNAGREGREGHVTVVYEDELAQVVTVTQGPFEPYFDLEDEDGVGLWGTLKAPKEGRTYTFTARTNMDFYAEAPDADWISVTKEGDVVTVVIDENPAAARSEYIYMGCSKEDEDYGDYGAMILVKQRGAAQAEIVWQRNFYWGIFPYGTKVSTAVAGDYMVLYSPGAVTAGFHLMSKEDGSEVSVMASPVANVTAVTNDSEGNVIVSAGGDFPLNDDWSLNVDAQIPLKVYVMSQADFLAGNFGEPILTYSDGFYGMGLDNIRVTGNAKGDAILAMTSGAGGGGTTSVAWEIKNGATTNAPTAYAAAATDGADLWDSFHGVTIGAGTTVDGGFYFAGYVGDYNIHYTAALGEAVSWSVAYTTGYTWEGAVNAGHVFTYEGHKFMAVIGMSYFAFSGWGLDPHLWIFNIDNPAEPVLMVNEVFYIDPDENNWQYGDNTDVTVVEENEVLYAYVQDAASSNYLKFEVQL